MLITVSNIFKSFQIKGEAKTSVLNDFSLSVKESELVALMGPSGVGKSTLLFLLGLLDKPDNGNIIYHFNNIDIDISKLNDTSASKIRNEKIGFIFQFHHLLPEFTAFENVLMPAYIKGKNISVNKKRAMELIDLVSMSHRLNYKPMELSGGEQQRIAIARALINKPQILLADEPTGNLDSKNAESVVDLLLNIKKDMGLTMIIATHSLEIASIADRICKMGDGKIIEEIRK
jgi:lipoprotein-releasing system ATP-binding protein